MKKILKKEVLIPLITFIIGVILSGCIAIYADISAGLVPYKNGKTVEQALDELYSKDITYIGRYVGTDTLDRNVTDSLVINDIKKGEYLMIAFRTLTGGGHPSSTAMGGEINDNCLQSITGGTFTSVGRGVYSVHVEEDTNLTLNFGIAYHTSNNMSSTAFVYLFKK